MPEAYIGRLLERTVFVVHDIWSGCGRDGKLGGGNIPLVPLLPVPTPTNASKFKPQSRD